MCSINHDKKLIFLHLNLICERKVIQLLEKKFNFKFIKERRPDHKIFCIENDIEIEVCHECFEKHSIYKYDQLFKYYSTSYFINRISNMNEEKWASYKKICIVRNPYHRLYSAWKYINDDKPNNSIQSIENLLNKKHFSDFDYKNWVTPQSINIFYDDNNNSQSIIDTIIYYESLENELSALLNDCCYAEKFSLTMKIEEDDDLVRKKIFIQHPNNAEDDSDSDEESDYINFDYKDFLSLIDNQKILDKINALFHDDFEKLNYEKITNIKNAKKINCT